MAMYLQLVRWSPEGAAGMLEGGFADRVEATRTMLDSIGANLLHYWIVADGEWHMIDVIEIPDDHPDHAALSARIIYQLTAAGTVDEMRSLRISDAAAVDAVASIAYTRPGETSS